MNPTIDGRITWDRESSCTLDLDEEIECWSLHCVSLEVRNLPIYDGLNGVDIFLDAFEREVPEK